MNFSAKVNTQFCPRLWPQVVGKKIERRTYIFLTLTPSTTQNRNPHSLCYISVQHQSAHGSQYLYGLSNGFIPTRTLQQQKRFMNKSNNHLNSSQNQPIKTATDLKEKRQSAKVGSDDPVIPTPPEHLNPTEKKIYLLLLRELNPCFLKVQDISGGCGSMYEIEIISERFMGLNMVKQQKMVYACLDELVKQWHGVRLKTSAPS
ncbi:hypothetical protein GcM1_207038 [Golovinomyces cichoracearum]|uniref:BolA-like protein 3 n=1 Tax=Golovinomyces cichoracearum TaxID=62708 RepID=A0A420IWG3_9PEZI|nr:hypothetical protein GcM1_207038 [Golovinomyces cichoracearum]